MVEFMVIPDSFPHVEVRAAGAITSNPMQLEMAIANVKTMITLRRCVRRGGNITNHKGKADGNRNERKHSDQNGTYMQSKEDCISNQSSSERKVRQRQEELCYGATDWCSAMSFVKKPNRKIRSMVNHIQLNKFVKCPTQPFPSPRDIVASIKKNAKCFAVFDVVSGYWKIPLSEKSKDLTTFMTEVYEVADGTNLVKG